MEHTQNLAEKARILNQAFNEKNKSEVRAYLELSRKFCNPNLKLAGNKNLLFRACELEWDDIVELILSKGANVNQTATAYKINALHVALDKRNENIVRILLNNGADVNIRQQRSGKTPLYLAVEYQWYDICRRLLERGVNVDIPVHGVRPLIVSIQLRDVKLTQLLLDFGADANSVPNRAPGSPLQIAVNVGCVKIAGLLLRRGANTDYVTNTGNTVLGDALRNDNEGMIRMLVENGANLKSFCDAKGMLPLHITVAMRWYSVVEFLLQNKADPNAYTNEGFTALLIAIMNQDHKMITILLQNGADINYKFECKVDALGFVRYFHGVCALHAAIDAARNEQIALVLLKNGADPCLQDKQGTTPLHMALQYDFFELAKALIQDGALSINIKDSWGRTPLFIAASKGSLEIATSLLEHGAQVNDCRSKGGHETILYKAMRMQSLGLVRKLLQEGATLSCKHITATTCLDEAVLYVQDKRMLELLLLYDFIHDDKEFEFAEDCYRQIKDLRNNTSPLGKPLRMGLLKYMARKKILLDSDEQAYKLEWSYFKSCKNELSKMQNDIFYEKLSFYALLTMNIVALGLLVRDEKLVKAFKQSNYRKSYPIYRETLDEIMLTVQGMREVFDIAEAVLGVVIIPDLPTVFATKILGYLPFSTVRTLNVMYQSITEETQT